MKLINKKLPRDGGPQVRECLSRIERERADLKREERLLFNSGMSLGFKLGYHYAMERKSSLFNSKVVGESRKGRRTGSIDEENQKLKDAWLADESAFPNIKPAARFERLCKEIKVSRKKRAAKLQFLKRQNLYPKQRNSSVKSTNGRKPANDKK